MGREQDNGGVRPNVATSGTIPKPITERSRHTRGLFPSFAYSPIVMTFVITAAFSKAKPKF